MSKSNSPEVSLCLQVPAHIAEGMPPVRVVGTEAEPLIVLADVCRVLGNANPSQVAARLRDGIEKTTLHIVEGGPGNLCVTERGFYKVILTSRAENAEPFQDWVCGEVLPSIRRHGHYGQPTAQPAALWDEIRPLIVSELRRALAERGSVQADDTVEMAAFVRQAWPECPAATVGRIVQRADTMHENSYGHHCRKKGLAVNAPLGIERSNLWCLTEAMMHYWRKAHDPQQRIEFPVVAVSVQVVQADDAQAA